MMNLLEATPVDSAAVEKTVEVTKEAVSGLARGDVSYLTQFLQQAVNFCIDAGKTILVAVIIYIVGRFIVSIINKVLANALDRRNLDPSIKTFLKSFVNILLTVLLIIAVVSALGVNTTSFAALLASFGVAAGMALSGNLSNFAGGLIILLLKPFRVGDFIEAQGFSGTVSEILIFNTVLKTPDNKVIYLPNGALSSGSITNYSREPQRRVDFTVSVEYGQDVEEAKKALYEIFAKDSRILTDPAPFVALSTMAASSIDLTARVWVNAADYWAVFFEMQETIYAEFNKRGIGFPFPQLTIHNA
ncbi:MAG: mechanosensitive ion channel [Bacteroidaceae bacterium]|nr:mechanosensitive ion channel [Bacteroidaceae bacterium]